MPVQQTQGGGATQQSAPDQTKVAAASGGGGTQPSAAAGAQALGGGGDLATALQSLVVALQQVVAALGGSPVAGGGGAAQQQRASIDVLAAGYLDRRHDQNGDGAIQLASEADHYMVRGDGKRVYSMIRQMATAADQMGNKDGATTAAEFKGFLAQFDKGGPNGEVAGDGFLDKAEFDAWHATGIIPRVADTPPPGTLA